MGDDTFTVMIVAMERERTCISECSERGRAISEASNHVLQFLPSLTNDGCKQVGKK